MLVKAIITINFYIYYKIKITVLLIKNELKSYKRNKLL